MLLYQRTIEAARRPREFPSSRLKYVSGTDNVMAFQGVENGDRKLIIKRQRKHDSYFESFAQFRNIKSLYTTARHKIALVVQSI